jgi:hypothetical protein
VVGPDCPRVGSEGCGGAAGLGGNSTSDGSTYPAPDGTAGSNGKPGTGTDPRFPSFNKNSGLPIMSVTTTSLPGAVRHRSYTETLAAKGGIAPYTWTITKLPKGLKGIKSAAIKGKPKESGTSASR